MPPMYVDVVDLRDFYETRLGAMARRMLRRRIRMFWPQVKGMTVLGVGFATPFLGSFRGEAEQVLAAMPAPQGVLHWPRDEPSTTFLTEDLALPLPDLSVDRLLLIHAVECSEQVRPLLRECWRVLKGSGRLLVVVPNRRGIWARFDRTPWGYGHPYSPGQLARLLRDSLFTPTQTACALYLPPFRSSMMLASAPAMERMGERWFGSAVSGVVLTEADKQVYAGIGLRPDFQREGDHVPKLLIPRGGGARSIGRLERSRRLEKKDPSPAA